MGKFDELEMLGLSTADIDAYYREWLAERGGEAG